MFWNCNPNSSPHIDAVLNKSDVTLQELMDEDDILQECKSQNKKLMEFLVRPEIMEELVTLTTVEPSPELDEKAKYKYPNIASELLTSDVPALNENLANNSQLLGKLYNFIEADPPLNPLLASYFSKTISMLISQKSEQNWYSYQVACLQVLEFLKVKENFVTLLLKHLGTSAIMDLMLKLITKIEGVDIKINILTWLDGQNVIQSLVGLLHPSVDTERQSNAAQLLSDIIECAREARLMNSNERTEPDPILTTIESSETVSLILDNILGSEKSETSIVGGIQVLLSLLNYKRYMQTEENTYRPKEDSNEKEHFQKVVESTTLTILSRLKDFHNILLDPPKKVPVKTTIGVLDPPLGNTRLQVTRLLAALLSNGNTEFMKTITKLGTVEVLLDLFFKYTWNNFLHTQVQQCVAFTLNSSKDETIQDVKDNIMYSHIIVDCRLIGRILEAWDDNDQKQAKPKGVRQGYMGHLISIANNIVQQSEKTALGLFIKEHLTKETLEAWENFISGPLAEVNKKHQILLGGSHPHQSNSESSNDEYRDVPFNQASILHQQVYTEYQMQPMTPPFIETYGYQDNDFNDCEDILHTSVDRLTSIAFDISTGDLDQQEDLFNQICAQSINTLDEEDDMCEEKEQEVTFQTVIDKHGGDWNAHSCSSDEEDQPVAKMDVDSGDPWTNSVKVSESAITPLSTSNPWSNTNDSTGATAEQQDGWANFDAAPFSDFGSAFSTADNSNVNMLQPQLQKNDFESTVCKSNDILLETVSSENKPPEPNKDEKTLDSVTIVDKIVDVKMEDVCTNIKDNVNDDDTASKGKDFIDNLVQLSGQIEIGDVKKNEEIIKNVTVNSLIQNTAESESTAQTTSLPSEQVVEGTKPV